MSVEQFATGCVRDTQVDKPRFDLIPVGPLTDLAWAYTRGAVKYGEHNWEKGMPFSRVIASLLRHVYAYIEGRTDEDHLSAVVFNAFALKQYEKWIRTGELPESLDDRRFVECPSQAASRSVG